MQVPITLSDVAAALTWYNARIRHSDHRQLDLSLPYDLVPHSHVGMGVAVCGKWPQDDYPGHRGPGVYLILDAQAHVLYIGKASARNTIGSRLAEYFGYDSQKRCQFKLSSWKWVPEYVATISIEPELHFEAPAVEEFLIARLRPPVNQQRGNTAQS